MSLFAIGRNYLYWLGPVGVHFQDGDSAFIALFGKRDLFAGMNLKNTTNVFVLEFTKSYSDLDLRSLSLNSVVCPWTEDFLPELKICPSPPDSVLELRTMSFNSPKRTLSLCWSSWTVLSGTPLTLIFAPAWLACSMMIPFLLTISAWCMLMLSTG